MTDHDSIAEILGEWREQQDRGIPVDPEEVIEAHPDLAEELRLSFAALAVLERDAVLDIEVLPGERLGDYRIVRELGRGGQAVVYLAEGSGQERRRVALKVLTGPWRHSEVALRRLCREADVASRLDHPGICEVYETGTAEGVPFIAMEYVEGQTLAKCLSQRVARSVSPKGGAESEGKRGATRQSEVTTSRASGLPDRARIDRDVEVIEKVAGAVHAAHHAGIVHRDLKPGNIMVRPDGEPVILDFGLAAVASTETTAITGPGELFGTLPYMSPEQIARRDIPLDARTDVYSLGVVLYECLTLRRPFEAPTREGLHRAILERVPPDPCRLNRTIPKGLRVILETALAKERQHRYQTALSFAEDLAAFREGRTLAARRAPAIVRAWRWSRREPLRAALLLAVLLATALAGYLVARWPDLRRGREQVQRQRIEGLLEEGFLELGEGSPDKALACFQEVLQRDPMVAEAVAGFALKHFLGGEPEGLLEVLDRHGAVTEGRSGLLRLRAAALRALGQTTQALEAERKAGPARSALDQFIVGSLAMVEGHRGDPQGYRSALAAFTRAILRSQHARALYHLEQAHAAGHVRDAPTAREAAAALEVLWPDSFQALFRRGYALQAVDPDAAIACYLRALELRPDRPVLYENIGFCYAEKSQPEEAVAWYRKALGLRESATAHRGVAQALGSMGRGEEAITEFQAALALEWTSRGADQLGRSLLDIGRHDAAMAVYQEMLDLEIDPVRALNGLALALNYKGELGPAVERLREALEVSPDDVDTRYNLGNVLSDQGLRSDAIAAYRKVIALDPDHAFAHHNLGKMLLDGGQVEEGLREMRRAIELAPDFRLARYNLGTALIERDRVEEGLAELRKVVEVASGSVEAALCRGILLFHSGSLGPAVEQFQGVLERVGRDPVWRGAVELWLQEARDLLQAETRLASILAGDGHPRDAADRDDLVRICLLGGRHHLAARLWREWIARVTSSGGVPGPGQRAQAACFAAMAGTGGAREDLDDDAQAQWRQQALVWLREDLEACRNSFERGRLRESRLSRILEDWRSREGLAGVRAAEALSRLPATERAAWTLLWKRVDELLAEVQ